VFTGSSRRVLLPPPSNDVLQDVLVNNLHLASLEPPSTRTFAGIVGASKTSNDVLPGVREDPSQGRLELLAMPRRAGDSRRS
jgi:hypothetical protein